MNLLLSLQEWRTSIFHGLPPRLCVLAGVRCVALILSGFLWLPGGLGPSAWWGQGTFHLSWLISRFPSLNGSGGVLSAWPSVLRWEIVFQLCCITVALLWKSPVSLLWLPPRTAPEERRRVWSLFLLFCESAADSEALIKCVRSLLPFLSSFLLLSVSDLVTHLMHTHADCWSVCSALRVAWISFRSLNGGLSSWHIWHLGFEWAVFGLLVFFTQQWGDTLVLEYSHLPGCSFYIGTRLWACTQASILYS